MGKSNVNYKNHEKINKNGDKVKIFERTLYNDTSYIVTSVNDDEQKGLPVSFETFDDALKASEKKFNLFD